MQSEISNSIKIIQRDQVVSMAEASLVVEETSTSHPEVQEVAEEDLTFQICSAPSSAVEAEVVVENKKRGGGGGGGFGGFGRFGGHDAHGDFGDMGFGGQQQQQPNPKPFKDSDVILLDKDSIYEIDNRRRLVLAVYFTNEALQADEFDTIKKFATKYKGIMNVIGVDCKKQKDICSSHGVKSVPLFRVYPQDKSKATVDFKGKISIPMLEQQTINRLENFVVKVGQRSIAGLKERALKESKQLFIIFPTKQSTSPMFMSLSTVSSC